MKTIIEIKLTEIHEGERFISSARAIYEHPPLERDLPKTLEIIDEAICGIVDLCRISPLGLILTETKKGEYFEADNQ